MPLIRLMLLLRLRMLRLRSMFLITTLLQPDDSASTGPSDSALDEVLT